MGEGGVFGEGEDLRGGEGGMGEGAGVTGWKDRRRGGDCVLLTSMWFADYVSSLLVKFRYLSLSFHCLSRQGDARCSLVTSPTVSSHSAIVGCSFLHSTSRQLAPTLLANDQVKSWHIQRLLLKSALPSSTTVHASPSRSLDGFYRVILPSQTITNKQPYPRLPHHVGQ